jgi:KUP system potassium uptake protein
MTIYRAAVAAGLLLAVDLAFLSANLLKILKGGWIPLTFGMLVFTIMTTWHYGLEALCKRNNRHAQQPAQCFARLRKNEIVRVPGVGIFLTRLAKQMPPIIVTMLNKDDHSTR